MGTLQQGIRAAIDPLSLPLMLFTDQDCLLPASALARLENGNPVLPLDLCWRGLPLPELRADRIARFGFEGSEYGAMLLGGEEPDLARRALADSAALVPARRIGLEFDRTVGRFAFQAKAHAHWAAVSRFCSACGTPLRDAGEAPLDHPVPLDDHAYGARYCPSCGSMHFPRMSPAVIVLVQKGDSILLAHNVRFPGNRHSLVAGFVEIGESLEDAVHREVREEASIEIKNLRYVRSQPWPFPDSLMLGFMAEWAEGEARPDGAEIDRLGWYDRDHFPELPMKGSIARSIIEAWAAGSLSV